MLLLNLSHPLTPAQQAQIEQLTGRGIDRLIEIMPQFDHEQPFAEQILALVDAVGLSADEWQTTAIVVNPPGYAPAAATLLAELHGRMGHFPAIVRLRPAPGSTPTRYEVAEIVNLQAVRDSARFKRHLTTIVD